MEVERTPGGASSLRRTHIGTAVEDCLHDMTAVGDVEAHRRRPVTVAQLSLPEHDQPAQDQALGDRHALGPNWFASVMGHRYRRERRGHPALSTSRD
jgi:hypothetical protein